MLKVESLVKNFGDIKVLKGINEEIKEGEVVVIIGPSGSGKSTFLRCLNRLEIPTSGNIYFEDKLITNKNILTIRKEIGMVFQSFNLFNNKNVLENLILAPTLNKVMTKKDAVKKAESLLKRIDLLDKKLVYPKELSGGQKQRIAILRALMMNPKIILLDEPTSALDPEMIDEVLNLMKDMAGLGMTMVVVTHEINFAKNFATKIIFMDEGNIVEEGSPDNILSNPSSKRLQEFLSKSNI